MSIFGAVANKVSGAPGNVLGDVDFQGGITQTAKDLARGDVFGDQRAAEEQQAAAKEALDRQIAEAQRAREFATGRSELAVQRAGASTQQGVDAIQAGQGGALAALGAGRQGALGQLGQGFGQARQDLAGVQSLQGLLPGATTAIGIERPESALEKLQREGIEGDAGFQFRRQQGEQAVNRAAAARGGRGGGRALKELSRFNQGLASQEFGAAAQRASAIDAQRQATAGRADLAALAAQRNQAGFARQGFGAQGQLAGLAAQQGRLGAGIETGFGAGQADVFGRSGAQQGALLGQLGQTQANATIGAGSQSTGLTQSLLGQFGGPTQYAGAGTQVAANRKKEAAGTILGFFSNDQLGEEDF